MFAWLAANAATIIISIILAILFFLAVRYLYKTVKRGGCAGCSGCSQYSDKNGTSSSTQCNCCEHSKK